MKKDKIESKGKGSMQTVQKSKKTNLRAEDLDQGSKVIDHGDVIVNKTGQMNAIQGKKGKSRIESQKQSTKVILKG